ncbi:HAD-like domain-containing protein [Chytridium lagenaria]|nr:HAD-like domain-containing protein [Chytridium lagenaria]
MLVNPWDYLGVANAINEALTMSKEENLKIPDQSNPTPVLDYDLITERYWGSKKRLLMFDYDGTLTPIRKTPGAAVPGADMLEYLTALVKDPNNYVFVISGRDQACLDNWLGHIPGLGLSAEHGCFIKYPEDGKWVNLSEEIDLSWKSKRCSITWHYRMADPDYGSFQAKECQNHLEDAILSKLPVEVLIGKKNLEVRPVSINKGEIVKRLVAAHPDLDFVFCVGDDKTDEDMFRSLRRSELAEEVYFNLTIGSATKKTKASWHVAAPEQLIELMGGWAGVFLEGTSLNILF